MSAHTSPTPRQAGDPIPPSNPLGQALLHSLNLHSEIIEKESDAIRKRDMKLLESLLAEKQESNENLARLWEELRASAGNESLTSTVHTICPGIQSLVTQLRTRNSINGQLIRCALDTTFKAIDILRGQGTNEATYAFPKTPHVQINRSTNAKQYTEST